MCAHCDDGWVKAAGLCMPCQSFDYLKLVLMVIVYVGLCTFFWHKATRLKKAADVDEQCQTALIGILTFFFQTIALLQIDTKVELIGFGFLNLDLDMPSAGSTDAEGKCLTSGKSP